MTYGRRETDFRWLMNAAMVRELKIVFDLLGKTESDSDVLRMIEHLQKHIASTFSVRRHGHEDKECPADWTPAGPLSRWTDNEQIASKDARDTWICVMVGLIERGIVAPTFLAEMIDSKILGGKWAYP